MVFLPSLVWQALPTPVSPLEKRMETPRAPSWAKREQVLGGVSWLGAARCGMGACTCTYEFV